MRRSNLPANWGFVAIGLTLFSALMFTGRVLPATGWRGPEPKDLAQAASNRIVLPIVMRFTSWQPWLNRINEIRQSAALPLIGSNVEWSAGAAAHARYIVNTSTLLPYEDSLSPHYSPEGNLAATFSLQLGQTTQNYSDLQAIDFWIRSPFQALSLLDPQWSESGFGSYRADGGLYDMAAVLDVVRGFQPTPAVTLPVYWPGNGGTLSLKDYSGADNPDPLKYPNCANARGLPIILQVGLGEATVSLTGSTPTIIKLNGSPINHCAFTASEFTIPSDQDATEAGRLLLNQRDAVVMMPTSPLATGSYAVTVTVLVDNVQRTYNWSFTIVN